MSTFDIYPSPTFHKFFITSFTSSEKSSVGDLGRNTDERPLHGLVGVGGEYMTCFQPELSNVCSEYEASVTAFNAANWLRVGITQEE